VARSQPGAQAATLATAAPSVNGVPATFDGYQDEIVLPRHGYVVARIRFSGFTGETVFHCHILAHEDAGMMANIVVSR
jgi:FtsP/CotA-like multicopper oxidase with cupredoxin domain